MNLILNSHCSFLSTLLLLVFLSIQSNQPSIPSIFNLNTALTRGMSIFLTKDNPYDDDISQHPLPPASVVMENESNPSTFSSWISSTVTPVDESLRSLDTIFADITCIVSLLASFWILCYRLPLRVCPKQRETMLLGKFFFRITC